MLVPSAYVVNAGDNTVSPINTTNKTVRTPPIPVGTQSPSFPTAGIAITSNGTTAYVANQGTNTVTPFRLATYTPGPAITVGNNPESVAITPYGTTAYVGNYADGTVDLIDTATNIVSPTTIPVGNVPTAIAITPDGTTRIRHRRHHRSRRSQA